MKLLSCVMRIKLAAPFLEEAAQPPDRQDVQVVCRLVEEKQVGLDTRAFARLRRTWKPLESSAGGL